LEGRDPEQLNVIREESPELKPSQQRNVGDTVKSLLFRTRNMNTPGLGSTISKLQLDTNQTYMTPQKDVFLELRNLLPPTQQNAAL
jgi:hypothetical protein